MTDLTQLPTEQLVQMYPAAATPLSGYSTEQLQAMLAPPSGGLDYGDIAKSAGRGLAKAGIGVAGTGGDVREMQSSVLHGLSKKFGYEVSPEAISSVLRHVPLLGGPTSDEVTKAVESVAGPFEQPQTTAGKYAQTVGEFAPAAVGGGGGVLRKAAQVAIPAIASEGAGQLSEGTAAEPYGKIAGAVIGAALTGGRGAAKGSIAAEDLKAAGQNTYDKVHAMGLGLKPEPIANLAHQIEGQLTNEGFTARNAAPVYEALGTLKNPPGAVVTSHNFDALRKEMVQATQSSEGSVRNAAGRTIGALDDYLANLPASHVISGDAQAASALFKEARANWAAMKRLEMVGGKIDLGELNAATSHSGMNLDNALRQAIKQLIRPDKYGKTLAQKSGFSPAEIAQMQKIARSTSPGNIVRILGNLAGGGGGIAAPLVGAAAAYETGQPAAALVPMAGFGLRKIGNAMTARQAGKLAGMVGQRSPLGAAAMPQAPQSVLPRGLLAAVLAAQDRQRGLLPLPQYTEAQ